MGQCCDAMRAVEEHTPKRKPPSQFTQQEREAIEKVISMLRKKQATLLAIKELEDVLKR